MQKGSYEKILNVAVADDGFTLNTKFGSMLMVLKPHRKRMTQSVSKHSCDGWFKFVLNLLGS